MAQWPTYLQLNVFGYDGDVDSGYPGPSSSELHRSYLNMSMPL